MSNWRIPLETGDTLVVPRAYVKNLRLLELLAHLKGRAAILADRFAEVRVAGDG